MTDVEEARQALVAAGVRPTLRAIGDRIGVGPERVRQLDCKIARWRRRERSQDEHVKLWRHLMLDALDAIQRVAVKVSNRKKYDGVLPREMWRPNLGACRLVAALPMLGPFNSLPRFKKHGPYMPFILSPLARQQREDAIEWFMTGGLDRAAATAYFNANDRGMRH